MNNAKIDILAMNPVPIVLITIPDEDRIGADETDLVFKIQALLGRDLWGCKFRGVELDRLPNVLESGIDVIPTNAPIFADFLDKALEYGGWPKLVLALDSRQMEKTFKEVPSSIPEAELAELCSTFPLVLPSSDGRSLWLTRLSEGDPRIGTAYEYGYAWWIRGDAFKALNAVLLFDHPDGGGRGRALSIIEEYKKAQLPDSRQSN